METGTFCVWNTYIPGAPSENRPLINSKEACWPTNTKSVSARMHSKSVVLRMRNSFVLHPERKMRQSKRAEQFRADAFFNFIFLTRRLHSVKPTGVSYHSPLVAVSDHVLSGIY